MKGCAVMEIYTQKVNENKVNPADPSTIPKFVDVLPIPAVAKPFVPWNYTENWIELCFR